jgi:Leu/Phe-tRNA-protein transferase
MSQFRQFVRELKAECPTISVRVRVCRTSKRIMGDCRRKDDHFLIRISNTLNEQEKFDTLVHEFAHAESFLEWENGVQHGPLWGVAHAKFYRVYERFVSQ